MGSEVDRGMRGAVKVASDLQCPPAPKHTKAGQGRSGLCLFGVLGTHSAFLCVFWSSDECARVFMFVCGGAPPQ